MSVPGEIVLHVGPARAAWWQRRLSELLPGTPVRLWDAVPDPAAVTAAVVWKHPPGGLRRFPALRVIVSIGAGVDHVLADPDLPPGVPLLRITGEDLTQRMTEYVVWQVLALHRRGWELAAARAAREWRQIVTPVAGRRGVGIMGLGRLGGAAARALAGLGFRVHGWARTPRDIPGVTCHAGAGELDAFLATAEILVCLLPLTPATEGILNRDLFARLPRGAALVNAARGGHLVEEDLIPALDQGLLCRAVLDVARIEPLPTDHPFWADPRIDITPHVASLIDPDTGARLIAENLRRFFAGEKLSDLIDPARGY